MVSTKASHLCNIPISIVLELGGKLCQCLPAAHALTGCDTTNALFGIGKKTAFATPKKGVDCEDVTMGLADVQIEEWVDAANTFVLDTYGANGRMCQTLDELRYKLATTSDKPAHKLPPTDDAFKQHALTANYQTMLWTQSHFATLEIDDPVSSGWYSDSTGLHPLMITQDPVPKEVRELTHLYCNNKECSDPSKCTCLAAGLRCIELCEYEKCSNVGEVEYEYEQTE